MHLVGRTTLLTGNETLSENQWSSQLAWYNTLWKTAEGCQRPLSSCNCGDTRRCPEGHTKRHHLHRTRKVRDRRVLPYTKQAFCWPSVFRVFNIFIEIFNHTSEEKHLRVKSYTSFYKIEICFQCIHQMLSIWSFRSMINPKINEFFLIVFIGDYAESMGKIFFPYHQAKLAIIK